MAAVFYILNGLGILQQIQTVVTGLIVIGLLFIVLRRS